MPRERRSAGEKNSMNKNILLIVMGLMGSLIANRGISLFTGSRTKRHRE